MFLRVLSIAGITALFVVLMGCSDSASVGSIPDEESSPSVKAEAKPAMRGAGRQKQWGELDMKGFGKTKVDLSAFQSRDALLFTFRLSSEGARTTLKEMRELIDTHGVKAPKMLGVCLDADAESSMASYVKSREFGERCLVSKAKRPSEIRGAVDLEWEKPALRLAMISKHLPFPVVFADDGIKKYLVKLSGEISREPTLVKVGVSGSRLTKWKSPSKTQLNSLIAP